MVKYILLTQDTLFSHPKFCYQLSFVSVAGYFILIIQSRPLSCLIDFNDSVNLLTRDENNTDTEAEGDMTAHAGNIWWGLGKLCYLDGFKLPLIFRDVYQDGTWRASGQNFAIICFTPHAAPPHRHPSLPPATRTWSSRENVKKSFKNCTWVRWHVSVIAEYQEYRKRSSCFCSKKRQWGSSPQQRTDHIGR